MCFNRVKHVQYGDLHHLTVTIVFLFELQFIHLHITGVKCPEVSLRSPDGCTATLTIMSPL